MERPSLLELRKIRAIADYQFGRSVGEALFPKGVMVTRSPRTGKIKMVYLKDMHLATLRSSDGLISLALHGAERLLRKLGEKTPLRATVREGFEEFIKSGRNLFAKHILAADQAIRPQNEVIVVDEKGRLVAVGRAVLSGEEMECFKLGVAVKVRRGVGQLKR
ncbi:pseudouridine synthase [Candidatus Bathyarchaeota archaeon]|nr:pseudouridine synthase [Candidatus Bathyarchaeota archaeon]